jgi:large repetitive protein
VVPTYTSSFTTGAGPDTTAPSVISVNPPNGATNVPTNTAIVVQFSEPMDTATIADNADYGFYLYDTVTGVHVAGTLSFSTDLTTATFVPSAPLAVNRQYYVYADYALDLQGNPQNNSTTSFTTNFTPSTTVPQVKLSNPENGLTGVPTNTVIQVLFNEPIRPESIGNVQLLQGTTAVPVTASLTNGGMVVNLSPNSLLLQNQTYTISITGVQDYASNTLSGTVTETFTTGPSIDLVAPTVTGVDPASSSTGLGTNMVIRVYFSKRLNPISLELNGYYVSDYYTGRVLPGVIQTIAANRMSATYSFNPQLQPETAYYANLSSTFTDVAGNTGDGGAIVFTTGSGAITAGPTVVTVSPPNSTTSTPVNTQVVVTMSAPVDPTSVTNNAITVTANGSTTPISGTVTVPSNNLTLTWSPATNLATSTQYNVSVAGFVDPQGNSVTPFTSSFTTSSNPTAIGPNALTLISAAPAYGATGVSPGTTSSPTQITLTFSEIIDAATINNIQVYDASLGSYGISGSWSLTAVNNGTETQATFTPAQPFPASSSIYVYTGDAILDYAGNHDSIGYATIFTTGAGTDTTGPTVTSVTPANGATNVGRSQQVVLTFSESINQGTANSRNIQVLSGDASLSFGTSISENGRTVTLSGLFPAGSTITVVATPSVTDLYGNSLAAFQSQFTTAADLPNYGPAVTNQIPANNATDVSASTLITLYTNGAAISPSSATGAVHVSQNGVIATGTASVTPDGHAIVFTPSSSFTLGAVVQIYVDQTLTDINGTPSNSVYSGAFTVQGNPASVAPRLITTNPVNGSTGVPSNVIVQAQFDQALASSTINATNVYLYDGSTDTNVAGTPSLTGPNNNVVQFVPSSALTSGVYYYLYMTNLVTNASGTPVYTSTSNVMYFNVGTTANSTAPTIVAVGPPNGSTGVGSNAKIVVLFNAPIDPISVSSSTIQVSGGGQTVVPTSITFSGDPNGSSNLLTTVTITPQQPMPDSTQMAITISGVTDGEGNAVTAQTTHFTTGAGPDFTAPTVVYFSALSGDTVPTNSVFSIEFSEPIDPTTVTINTTATSSYYRNFFVYDYSTDTYLASSVSLSSDLKTVTITPLSALVAGHTLEFGEVSVLDLSGNVSGQNTVYPLTVGTSADTTPPVVTEVSPPANLTGVPTNTLIQAEFSSEIAGTSIQGVQLLQGTTVIPTTATLSRHNTVVTLTPAVPLSPSTVYTISISGVTDVRGNVMSSFTPQTFTTGGTVNLTQPTVLAVSPANGTISVSASTTVFVQFSSAMDPLTFDQSLAVSGSYAGAELLLYSTGAVIPCTVSFSADYKTVTLTPTAALSANTQYEVFVPGNWASDLAGNLVGGFSSTFTTGSN